MRCWRKWFCPARCRQARGLLTRKPSPRSVECPSCKAPEGYLCAWSMPVALRAPRACELLPPDAVRHGEMGQAA